MKLLIDCDPGVDDALALIIAAADPQADIRAVTTVAGNVNVDICTRNARYVLGLAGRDVPIVSGARAPLHRDLRDASETHGDDGIGNLHAFRLPDGSPKHPLPHPTPGEDRAVETIIEAIRSDPGNVILVATGPLTNLARVVEADADALGMAQRIVIMGGTFRVPGNVTPDAEFNFWCDPEAAAIVVAQPIEKTLVGLDVTHQVVLDRGFVETKILALGTPLAEFVRDATDVYARFDSRKYGVRGSYVHDAVAMVEALHPGSLGLAPMRVRVGDGGECILDDGPPNADVAVSVDESQMLNMLHGAIASLRYEEGRPCDGAAL